MTKINADELYTTQEVQDFLKVSKSTIKRYLKKGVIKASKVGGRYKIFGREILKLVSPQLESKAKVIYKGLKQKTKKRIQNW
jgi:excisionase family DNA binding protein